MNSTQNVTSRKNIIFKTILIFLILFSSQLPACAFDDGPYYQRIFAPDHLSVAVYQMPAQLEEAVGYSSQTPPKQKLSFCPPTAKWDSNLYDWSQIASADYDSIEKAVYSLPLTEIKAALNPKNQVSKNRFIAALQQKKGNVEAQEALQYLEFAKSIEPLVTVADEWESVNNQKRDLTALSQAQKKAESILVGVKSKSIRARYVFQILRLMHYRGAYSDVVSFADKNLPTEISLQVEYRSLSLKAGALRWLGRKVESKLLFAQIADESADLRMLSIRNFDFIDLNQKEESDLIQKAKLPAQRNNVLFLLARAETGYSYNRMIEMNSIDKNSAQLRYLAVREMALIEDSILPNFISEKSVTERPSFWRRAWAFVVRRLGLSTSLLADDRGIKLPDSEQRSKTLAFFQKKASDKNVANEPALWSAMSAYLAYYNGDIALSRSMIEMAKQQNGTKFVQHRIKLLELLLQIESLSKPDTKQEFRLISEFLNLYSNSESDNDNDNYWHPKEDSYFVSESGAGLQLFRNRLQKFYKKTNRSVESILVEYLQNTNGGKGLNLTEFSRDSSPLLRYSDQSLLLLLNLIETTKLGKSTQSSSTVNELLLASFPFGRDNVLDALASHSMNASNYATAINYYKKQSSQFEKKLVYDFVQNYGPFQNPEFETSAKLQKMTRRQFAEEMQRLSQKADQESYYRMAIGLYNTSWHGRWWILGRDYWSMSSEDLSQPQLKQALLFLEKASNGSDSELVAKSLYMSLRITRALEWEEQDQWRDGGPSFSANERKLYKRLVSGYGTTNFYKQAKQQCSYLNLLEVGR